ncbi:MAG: hypothetical protein U0487_03445 [Patescibacteria group bacterium]
MNMSLSPYRIAAIGATAVVVAVAIGSLFLIDSPMKERLRRADDRRLSDLQSISYGIDSYVLKNKQQLPESLDAMIKDRDFGYLENQIKDPETQKPYEYKKTGDKTYELCAEFALSTKESEAKGTDYTYRAYGPAWDHEAGRHCFSLDIRDTAKEDVIPLEAPVIR